MRQVDGLSLMVALALAACGNNNDAATRGPSGGAAASVDGVDGEASVGIVGGAITQDSAGVALGAPLPRRTPLQRFLDQVSPIGVAWGAMFSCSGDMLAPPFAGPAKDPYQFTPVSCMITWNNGKSTTSKWSGTFTLNYGMSCDNTHARLVNQAASCSITRTTSGPGNTRTITGSNGGTYAITHSTNGAGTGWDASVMPAPSNNGVSYTCSATGCDEKVLVIGGSHLTGTLAAPGGQPHTWWDHTVTTGAGGVTVMGKGRSRTVSGSVITQHNLLKYTATTTFNNVTYGEEACCFPTAGSVTTTFSRGDNKGKSETVTFSAVCGEATVTLPSGRSIQWTFQHCL